MSEDTDNQTENLNLIDIMNTWIYQNGYPVVSVNRDNETGTIVVNQVGSLIIQGYSKYIRDIIWFSMDVLGISKHSKIKSHP